MISSVEDEMEEQTDSDSPECMSEEDVRREKEASLARTEVANAHMRTQEGVMYRIHAKLADTGDYDVMPHNLSAAAGLRRVSNQELGCGWPVSQLEGLGSSEQQHGARVVAEEILRRKERWRKFCRRRSELLEQDKRSREQIAAQLEVADARCTQMQRERLEESHRRAFAAQQRRNEQQKVFRENQREQERMCEAYYLKSGPMSWSVSRSASSPSKQLGTPTERARSAPESESSLLMNEDIYRSIAQSHATNSATLERAEKFVAENERRTETNRRKLFGSSYGRINGNNDEEGSIIDKARLRVHVKNIQKLRGFIQQGKTIEELAATSAGSLPKLDPMMTPKLSLSSSGDLARSGSLPQLSSTWKSRIEKCAKHAEEVVQHGQEKLERDQEALRAARERINVLNIEKTEKANELNMTWKKRNKTAAQMREELAFTSDKEALAKQTEVQKRIEEEKRRISNERHELAHEKANHTNEAKLLAQRLKEEAAEKHMSQISRKEALSLEHYATRLKEFGQQVAAGEKYSEEAKAKYELKTSQSREFSEKARQEMEMKRARSQKVLMQKQQSMIERARASKRERTSSGKLVTSAIPDGLPSPSSAPQSPRLDSPKGDDDDPQQELDDAVLPGQAGTRLPARDRGNARVADVLSLELEVAAAEAASNRRATRGRRHGSTDSDDEGAFKRELESRGIQWLHELRRKKAIWKPI